MALALILASFAALYAVTSSTPGYAFDERLLHTSGWRLAAAAIPASLGLALLASGPLLRRRLRHRRSAW